MLSPHQHFDLELNFVESGWVELHCSGTLARIEAGECGLFWAACPHQIIQCAPETQFCWITFPVRWFLDWKLGDSIQHAVLTGKIIVDKTAAQLTGDSAMLERWLNDQQRGSNKLWEMELSCRMGRLASNVDLVDATHTSNTLKPMPGASQRILQLAVALSARFSEDISIAQLAAEAGLNPNYAAEAFKRLLGCGPKEYVTRMRLAQAQRLLLTSDLSVLDVAYASGFQSPSRFYAWFERAIGCSPQVFRKKHQAPGSLC
ncbi:MAG: helix-turn-helix domain-containing protein [Verrucomicrobiota bacterium]|nr:helix-turn-helix domain-containing protein [Verrucomicrobiota bacterium]